MRLFVALNLPKKGPRLMVSYSQGRMMRSTLATAKRHKSRLVLLGAGRKRVRLDTPALTVTLEGLGYEQNVNRADEHGILLE